MGAAHPCARSVKRRHAGRSIKVIDLSSSAEENGCNVGTALVAGRMQRPPNPEAETLVRMQVHTRTVLHQAAHDFHEPTLARRNQRGRRRQRVHRHAAPRCIGRCPTLAQQLDDSKVPESSK